MSKHKFTTRICACITVLTVALALVFSYFGASLGIQSTASQLSYTSTLFDTSRVHQIDISIDESDWDDLVENASAKTYYVCDITIDGETVSNAGIRAKGNSSLTSVPDDSERYSLKVEFDHYDDSILYRGLDKLSLNNMIQDNTYLKEYLVYDMMQFMDVDAPLCSFAAVYLNGEYFGLYLAVEGIEESFAQREYGSDVGNLYKPDSMDMDELNFDFDTDALPSGGDFPTAPSGQDGGTASGSAEAGEAGQDVASAAQGAPGGGRGFSLPDGWSQDADGADGLDFSNFGGGFMGSSSQDVALQYIDDDTSSYQNIWDGAVFDITESDQTRLIASLKQLNEGENLDEVVDVDEVLRYFVVHNFSDNFDSYTGSMMHNYYLRENDGQLSIIAWDYNLAFSAFGGAGSAADGDSSTQSLANYPIDTPVSGTTLEDRPLLGQLLADETYLELYHTYFEQFLAEYFDSGRFAAVYQQAVNLISSYVEDDPTAFCTYADYQTGVETLEAFIELRVESVRGQLDGSIPSTSDGQQENPDALIDTGDLDVSLTGSNSGGGGRMTGEMPELPEGMTSMFGAAPDSEGSESTEMPSGAADADTAAPPDGQTAPSGVQPPGQTDGTTPDAANGTQTDGQSAAPSFDQLSSFSSLSSVFSPDTWLVIGICVVTLLLSIGFVLFWLKR